MERLGLAERHRVEAARQKGRRREHERETGASTSTLIQVAPPSEPIDQKVRSRNCRSSLT